jgi:hypothetical protein
MIYRSQNWFRDIRLNATHASRSGAIRVIYKVRPEEETEGKFHQNSDLYLASSKK